MPAIAKTSNKTIITAARQLIEQAGLDALSMHTLAAAVGIRPPSLYKRFQDRDAIIRAVQQAEFADLEMQIAAVATGESPAADLRAIARSHWQFAHARPHIYRIIFAASPTKEAVDIAVRANALRPMLEACNQLVGPARGLMAARTLTAYVHGFATMEIAGAFHLGGSVEDAFLFGLDTIIHGLTVQTVKPSTK